MLSVRLIWRSKTALTESVRPSVRRSVRQGSCFGLLIHSYLTQQNCFDKVRPSAHTILFDAAKLLSFDQVRSNQKKKTQKKEEKDNIRKKKKKKKKRSFQGKCYPSVFFEAVLKKQLSENVIRPSYLTQQNCFDGVRPSVLLSVVPSVKDHVLVCSYNLIWRSKAALTKSVRPSAVRPSVRPFVRPSVRPSVRLHIQSCLMQQSCLVLIKLEVTKKEFKKKKTKTKTKKTKKQKTLSY